MVKTCVEFYCICFLFNYVFIIWIQIPQIKVIYLLASYTMIMQIKSKLLKHIGTLEIGDMGDSQGTFY